MLVLGGARGIYVEDHQAPGYLAAQRTQSRAELRRLVTALQSPEQRAYLFAQNPEWVLMSTTFLADALAASGRTDPEFALEAARGMDALLDSLLAQRAETYLLPYHRQGTWRVARGADEGIFYLGEIAFSLGLRRQLSDDNPRWRTLHRRFIAGIERVLARAPNGYAESYPNEAWTFCNVIALAALIQSDRLEGTDHQPQVQAWRRGVIPLMDLETGLLPSAYTLDGRITQGVEGSSIWAVITFLSLVDPELARLQYAAALKVLGRDVLGFAWAREWPANGAADHDVDSGMTVLGVGPASTGFSLAAAHAMQDAERYARTKALLDVIATPVEDADGARHYLPSNLMGDVVFAFSAGGIQ